MKVRRGLEDEKVRRRRLEDEEKVRREGGLKKKDSKRRTIRVWRRKSRVTGGEEL